MTGRRKAERRESPGGRAFAQEGDVRRGPDRREFLRRFSDLGAELEALNQRNEREELLMVLRSKLARRGVKA